MRKLNKRSILLSTIIASSIIICVPNIAYANGFTDVICNSLGAIICFIADGIVYLCDTLGGQFDKLIFNYDGSTFNSNLNLMILKGDKISLQLMSIYKVMQYIGSLILITISLFITFDFLKASSDSQHKVILLDRLKKLLLAIFLLNGIPIVLDVLLAINYAITDTFRLVSGEFASGSIDYGKTFLTEIFKGLFDGATGSEALVLSLVYLVASVINIWLIIFYMLRDLGIAFLFILAPIMVCMLPYRWDLLVSWLKEMSSNIFTQAIQAIIFTVITIIVIGISDSGNNDLYSQIFALVGFATFIPMTATVKKLLGLEGSVGAAYSKAGLGGTIMTLGLAGKTIGGIKNQANMIKNSNERISDLKAERDSLGKYPRTTKASSTVAPLLSYNNGNMKGRGNISSIGEMAAISSIGGGLSDLGANLGMASMYGGESSNIGNIDTKNLPRDRNTIQGEINAIRKQTAKSVVGSTFSVLGGGAMAIGTSGLGSLGAFAGYQVGSSVGGTAGVGLATGLADLTSSLSEKAQDGLYGKGIRPETFSLNKGNKNWSLGNVKYNMDNMKKNISDNMDLAKSDMQYSWFNTNVMSHTDEEREDLLIRKEARQDEIAGLTGDPLRETQYYDNEKDSRLQTQKLIRQGEFSKANRYRLNTSSPTYNSENIKNLENTSDKAMLYTDQNSSVLFKQDEETGEREILATYEGNPNLSTPTMENVSFNMDGDMPIDDLQRDEFREQAVNLAISKHGADSISNKSNEYYGASQKLIESEATNLINQHMARVQTLRKNTGSNTIVINSAVEHQNVSSYNSVPNAVQDINIDIPNNFQTQHSKDIYSNIEMSKSKIDSKQIDFINKQVELMQQQQYTESLQQGANELAYYDELFENSQFN